MDSYEYKFVTILKDLQNKIVPRDVPAVPGGVKDGDGLSVAPGGLGVVLGRVLVHCLRHETDGRVQAHCGLLRVIVDGAGSVCRALFKQSGPGRGCDIGAVVALWRVGHGRLRRRRRRHPTRCCYTNADRWRKGGRVCERCLALRPEMGIKIFAFRPVLTS